ncbi:MAG TPA: helix-turn-helix domain-containing protein [Solirubrobacteraceae bacterium]|jgi:hypothetical protein
MPEIGQTLREARMRARIDVSEIESQTKIRAKYLRALENEEWDLLPGPTFVKSFLRTYAQALGLDDKALVEEYRLSYERPSESELQPIVSTPQSSARAARQRAPRPGPSRAYVAAIATVTIVIVLLVIGLLSGGSSNTRTGTSASTTSSTTRHRARHQSARTPAGSGATGIVALSVQPTATVYVCLLDEHGRKLIAGATLQGGAREPTFHSKRFAITLGNNAVRMYIDGRLRPVAPSSRSIGYTITQAGRRSLPVGQQPTCR